MLLIARARASGVRIDAIPGASALTAAFSIAGISGNEFVFLGFVPQKKGRQTFFKSLNVPMNACYFLRITPPHHEDTRIATDVCKNLAEVHR